MEKASKYKLNRRNFLKLSGGTLAGVYALGLAAACSKGGQGRQAEGGPTTVTFYHDKAAAGWDERLKEMSVLSSRDANVKIEPVSFSDTTSYQQAVQSSFRVAKDAPGVFIWWSGQRLRDIAKEGVLEDVSSIWQAQQENLPESLANGYTTDGKQYGVPADTFYYTTFYNKRIFEEHKLTPPKTWDDVISIADTIKEAGIRPFFATVTDRWPAFIWFGELMIRHDPDFYERLMQGEESYTDPVVVEVMQQWKSMFDKGYFSKLDISYMTGEHADQVADGEIAMVVQGDAGLPTYVSRGMMPEEELGAFILPNVNPDLKDKVVTIETQPVAIPANAPDIDASKNLAEWWVKPEARAKWLDTGLATVKNAEAKSRAKSMLTDIHSTVKDGNYRLMQRFWEATLPQIVEAAVDEFARFMLNPNQYMDVLENIEATAQKEWSKRGKQ